jgi:hypothetical protein
MSATVHLSVHCIWSINNLQWAQPNKCTCKYKVVTDTFASISLYSVVHHSSGHTVPLYITGQKCYIFLLVALPMGTSPSDCGDCPQCQWGSETSKSKFVLQSSTFGLGSVWWNCPLKIALFLGASILAVLLADIPIALFIFDAAFNLDADSSLKVSYFRRHLLTCSLERFFSSVWSPSL